MFSYASSFFNYLLSWDKEEDDDNDVFEAKLAELQIEDAIKNNEIYDDPEIDSPEVANENSCFKKSGVITYIDEKNDYVLIDGCHYFDTASCSYTLRLNDKVFYLGYYKHDNQVVIVKILSNEGNFWGDEDVKEEVLFSQADHTLLGQVAGREGRMVYMANGDIKFDLDKVDGTFVPIVGDVLEMSCKVMAQNENGNVEKSTAVSSKEVLEVTSFRPLGLKIVAGTVTEWNGEFGLCDRKIYFEQQCLPSDVIPQVGAKVMMKIIESYQDNCIFRAIQLQVTDAPKIEAVIDNDDESTLCLENDENLEITYPLTFDTEMKEKLQISLNITNKSDQMHIINKWIILSKRRDSQISMSPSLSQPYRLYPGHTVTFTITCHPKFMGKTKEHLVFLFRGFKVKRVVHINVMSKQLTPKSKHSDNTKPTMSEVYSKLKESRNNNFDIVRGRNLFRKPNFIAVRIGFFHVPDKIWKTVLGDSQHNEFNSDKRRTLARLSDNYPCLCQDLTIYNYVDKMHSLMYLEEIQETINLRMFDIPKAYLVRYKEYLSLEVKGLAERRPSLIVGDRVIVKDIVNTQTSKYEGIIHEIRGSCVLMKFSQVFHEYYSGGDVSVEFNFNRGRYRHAHHCINAAITRLGSEILFPVRLVSRPPQVPPDSLASIEWFNVSLNHWQKTAISNILLGECRPKPYCIYGPPGTGKTVTVVETIMQILANMPHSRILVAAPSNSAANLIAERLIDYKDKCPHSLVRVIAYHYFKADNIPAKIKPYCVTVDIAQEGSSRPKQEVQNDVQLHCQSSFIGRHRVTIGTCNALGALHYLGFPKGHFTHVIVDEAGQATEPEIMVPLTLTDYDNGQIILAGDPMQLGPVVLSPFATEFGLSESFLQRILDTRIYQKDFAAFQSGFNEKVVTKLNDNYRSLKEVLKLPSEMFYDGSLEERFDRKQPWVVKVIEAVSEVFEIGETKAGGIYIHGIRGSNTRAEDSPSWYNPQEATMVALTTSKLYKKNVSPDDIGIITPYLAQVKHIRSLFEGMGLPQPKIGSVEEFQGQEKPLIMISTVRSTDMHLYEDIKHTLGFVKNAKRLNVALTRAQVAVILFCDPHLLSTDQLWSRVIDQAVKEDKYMGCDLPKKFSL